MQLEATIYGEKWVLDSQKACFLPDHKTLIISDLHIGKLSHFRKAGIGIPTIGEEHNLKIIRDLIGRYQPNEVIFLGDLFHSEQSPIWTQFKKELLSYESISFELILGNHDVFVGDFFEDLGHVTLSKRKQLNHLLLTHEPLEPTEYKDGLINICGHIHPAVLLRGKGRQKLRVPCFFFGTRRSILPAFGSFTGTFVIETKMSDRVFGLMDDEVVEL